MNILHDSFRYRADGRIEWICKHGVGHTILEPQDHGKYNFTHGCDGCCKVLYDESSD